MTTSYIWYPQGATITYRRNMSRQDDFHIEAMATNDAATAVVYGNGNKSGAGSAKRHPIDKPKPQVGMNLAIARALEDLAKKYHKAAEKAAK